MIGTTSHRLGVDGRIARFELVAVLIVAVGWVGGMNPCRAETQGENAPRRIMTIAPNSAEIICALGACDRIIAVSKFCVYPPELEERPKIGGLFDPDLEKIAALRPDLIVVRGRSESIEKLGQQRGIEVYHDRTDNLADIERTARELGARLGREAQASKLIASMRDRIDAIKARVKGKTEPRVLIVYARQPDRLADLLTTGPDTFMHEMIEIAGGVNVFGDLDMRYPQISLESIVARRPDVIIELLPEVELTPDLKRQMHEQWRRVGSFPAVTSGRIHFLTDNHCLIPSPRYVEIIEKVSHLLHPDDHGRP